MIGELGDRIATLVRSNMLEIPDFPEPGVLFRDITELFANGPASRIDETYRLWKSKGVQIVQPPYDDVFGRTFVVADPDGNLIRVSLVD